MLLNRLQDHAAGKVEMKNSQVKAAEILLRKVTPDLAATQLTGSEGGPMVLEVVRFADKNSSQ